MEYETLLDEALHDNIWICESFFFKRNLKGLYIDGNIALSNQLSTTTERKCILAEELGHYHTSYGNITDISSVKNNKQELRARTWAYNKLINLNNLISAYKHNCTTKYEIANYLDVTECFLLDYINHLQSKHGTHLRIDNYIIYLCPYFAISENY